MKGLDRFREARILFDTDVALLETLLEAIGVEGSADAVLLGFALALRAPRVGSVCVHLPTVAEAVVPSEEGAGEGGGAAEVRVGDLDWPDPSAWIDALRRSPAVSGPAPVGLEAPFVPPFVLDGDRLYLRRLWDDEVRVADHLLARAAGAGRDEIGGSYGTGGSNGTGAGGRLQIVTGGPGSGKTTHIAQRLLERLEQGEDPARIALAAPTGKAAGRMRESLFQALARVGASEAVLARAAAVRSDTLHRLLQLIPGRLQEPRTRDRQPPPLDFDQVIVDEVSMVSLPLLAHLLDRLPPAAHLALVGDPDQLASVEAGCVLSDLVAAGEEATADGGATPLGALAGALTRLTSSWRFSVDSGIGRLAAAIRRGDADQALHELRAGDPDLQWIDPETREGRAQVGALKETLRARAREMRGAAEAGDAKGALRTLLSARTLCARREGRWGIGEWNREIEEGGADRSGDRSYPGQPLLVTRNDPRIELMNGDLGVVVRHDDALRVVFERGDGALRWVPPVRVPASETVHAMTIHKSQGSEFDRVEILLPEADSQLLTRELLYTGVTRARRSVTLVGSEVALRSGITRRAARATGLAARLGGR
jgi:exodeoxyribonuclease V alpha subunit